MDNNIVLTPNLFLSAATECLKGNYQSNDIDGGYFLDTVGGWYFGTQVSDRDKCIKCMNAEVEVYLGEWANYLVDYGPNGIGTFCLSEYCMYNQSTYDDYTRITMMPTNLGDQLLRYNDLLNKPVNRMAGYVLDWDIYVDTSDENYSKYTCLTCGYSSTGPFGICPMCSGKNISPASGTCAFNLDLYSNVGMIPYISFSKTFQLKNEYLVYNIRELFWVDNDIYQYDDIVPNTLVFQVQFNKGNVQSCDIYCGEIGLDASMNMLSSGTGHTTFFYYFTVNDFEDMLSNMVTYNTKTSLSILPHFKGGQQGKTTVYLNNEWQTCSANPSTTTYASFQSYKNKGVNYSYDSMYIDISGYTSFDVYIRSYAESSYDYVMISQLDQNITSATSPSTTSLVKAATNGKQQASTALTGYTKVTYSGITNGQHRIQVIYRKDSSQSQNDDRGYVLVPKPCTINNGAPSGGGGTNTSTINWTNYYFENCNGTKIYLNSSYMYISGTIGAYDEEGNFIRNLNATLSGATISFSNAGNNNLSDYAYVYLSCLFYGVATATTSSYDPMTVWLYCSVNEDGTVSASHPRAIIVWGANNAMEFTDNNDDGIEIEISTLFPGNPSETVYIDQPGTPYGLSMFTSDIGFIVANGYTSYPFEITASDPNGQQPYYNNGVTDGQTVSLIPSSVQNIVNVFYWNERFVQNRYGSYFISLT